MSCIIEGLGLTEKEIKTVHELYELKDNLSIKTREENKWKTFEQKLGEDGIDLLERMLKFLPLDRIGIEEIIYHPFFDEVRGAMSLFSN